MHEFTLSGRQFLKSPNVLGTSSLSRTRVTSQVFAGHPTRVEERKPAPDSCMRLSQVETTEAGEVATKDKLCSRARWRARRTTRRSRAGPRVPVFTHRSRKNAPVPLAGFNRAAMRLGSESRRESQTHLERAGSWEGVPVDGDTNHRKCAELVS